MKSKSIHGKSSIEFSNALIDSMADGFKPTLAIVFISVKQDRVAVLQLFQESKIDVFGATSCGEFTDGYQDDGSIVALLLDLNRDAYVVLHETIGPDTVSAVATRIAQRAKQVFDEPSLIVCSTGMTDKGGFFDGVTLVSSLESALGQDVTFFGGMAGDDMQITATYIFTGDKETNYGIAALVFDANRVEMQGMAITGWQPVGIARTITKSIGNLLYTIDDKPAVEMFLRYLGKQGDEAVEGFNLMEDVSMHYPLLLDRERGEPLPLTPLSIDQDENALVCDQIIPQGGKIWFSMPPDLDIADTIIAEASKLRDSSMPDADALLVFSCAGRINVLGPLVTSENEGLHELWNVPMAGFFSYGEYGRAQNRHQEFHSGACCWVALKEK